LRSSTEKPESLTAKLAKGAKEEKSFTAKDTKDAEEKYSLTAKAAKKSIIRTKPGGREGTAPKPP